MSMFSLLTFRHHFGGMGESVCEWGGGGDKALEEILHIRSILYGKKDK